MTVLKIETSFVSWISVKWFRCSSGKHGWWLETGTVLGGRTVWTISLRCKIRIINLILTSNYWPLSSVNQIGCCSTFWIIFGSLFLESCSQWQQLNQNQHISPCSPLRNPKISFQAEWDLKSQLNVCRNPPNEAAKSNPDQMNESY